ncbi:ROK family protein [Bifidobacterium aemilianum]|nr:ROK family protein [Bifidobacterium aemilianum]
MAEENIGQQGSSPGQCQVMNQSQGRGQATIGIDVGGTSIGGVLLDASGQLLSSAQIPTVPGNCQVLDGIISLVDSLMETAPGLSLQAVGVGIPGRVDRRTGLVTDAVNVGLVHMELGAAIAGRLALPVAVENDVNLAALGAICSQNYQTGIAAYINFGTGLAAGIIEDGTIMHGATGAIGEIGHIPLDPHRIPCKCGQEGCLETVASGSAVARLWPVEEGYPLPSLLAAAKEGDSQAREALSVLVGGISMAIELVCLTFDPQFVVLGGGMTRVGQPLLDLVTARLDEMAAHSHFISSLALPSRLRLVGADQPVGAIGAAILGQRVAEEAGRL